MALDKEKALFSACGSHSSIRPVVRPLSLGYLHRVVCCGSFALVSFPRFFRSFSSNRPVMGVTSHFLSRVRLRLHWQRGPGAGHRHGLVRAQGE